MVRSSSVRQIRAGNSERQLAKPTFQTNTVTHYNKFKRKGDNRKFLEVGQNVMCIHNKEMATIRYVGHTDFAPGIWIGLELKRALGEALNIFLLSICFRKTTVTHCSSINLSGPKTQMTYHHNVILLILSLCRQVCC